MVAHCATSTQGTDSFLNISPPLSPPFGFLLTARVCAQTLIMSTTDSIDYTADIQLMTSVLTGQKISTAHSITGRRRDYVRPFAHLATLLACSANPVAAATGLISPEGLDSIVVVSNSHTDKERTEPFEMQPILGVGAPERTETLSLEEVLNPRP